MTQWKLVPVEPTPEMLGAWYRIKNGHHFHDDAPCEDRSDYAAYRAMLSAAPSPVDEVEAVKAAFKAMPRTYEIVPEDQWMEQYARTAISALRPAPKLSEEERARVEEVRERNSIAVADAGEIGIPEMTELHGWRAISDREILLSLIDKLTEAG